MGGYGFRRLVLCRENLDLGALFQRTLACDDHILTRVNATADFDHAFTLISELDLDPGRGVLARDINVILAILLDEGSFRYEDRVGFGVGANIYANESSRAETGPGFESDG